MPDPCYICDSDALINLYEHFPKRFRKLRKWVKSGKVMIPERVYNELKSRWDRKRKLMEKWAKDYPDFVVYFKEHELREELQKKLAQIELTYGETIRIGNKIYGGFWKSKRGRKAADGQVIALGKVLNCIVVSDDKKIRLVCMLEDVPSITWTEFARRLGANEDLQLF